MNIVIINGPNLNLLGKREPEIYGNQTFEFFFEELQASYPQAQLTYFQANAEGLIIDELHRAGFTADGIILNAGAYTHTSIAISDAIKGITTPVIEVHLSNVWQREPFRHHSYLSPVCRGVVAGFGLQSYRLALEYFLSK